jgi:hypothetical protein
MAKIVHIMLAQAADAAASTPASGWLGLGGAILAQLAFACLPLILLLFPDGRLPAPRWRWAVRAVVLGTSLVMIGIAFVPGRFGDYPALVNPAGIDGFPGDAVQNAGHLLLLVGTVGCAAAMVLRLRSARGDERLQLKWLAYVAALLGPDAIPLALFFDSSSAAEALVRGVFLACIVVVPVTIGAAILRYRLYDIDRVISRSLAYALVTALLAAAYFGLVLLVSVVSPLSRTSPAAVALSTLTVAALFGPARRRVQAFVDRRFNRASYDAACTLEGFSARLRDLVEMDSLRRELLGVVSATMQPARVALWLRDDPS